VALTLRAIVVEDSVVFRRSMSDALGRCGAQVIGTAPNGRIGLQRILELKPDIVTLDIEMPEMDGIAVLTALRDAKSTAKVIVVSSVTTRSSRMTVRALELGAFDFVTKPTAESADQALGRLYEALRPRLAALGSRLEMRRILSGEITAVAPPGSGTDAGPSVPPPGSRLTARPEMVLIGVSTGGPNALTSMLPGLPRDLPVPVLIVQHMPPVFTAALAESLDGKCAIRVCEAKHNELIENGTAYIAPGGRQMRLAPAPDGKRLQLTDDPPENNCKPAVDYLFRSAANHYPGKSLAVILTGMGSDGTLGLRLLKRNGCPVIAQDEASCVVYGMPRAAVEAGVVDSVLPLEQIAGRIAAAVRGGVL
jgi:two-component system chemotaxis response regulator CheB